MTFNEEKSYIQTHKFYKRYSGVSKGVGLWWGLLTLCFLIMNIIVFSEPQWIGDTDETPGRGWAGLYKYCLLYNNQNSKYCTGNFNDFGTIVASAFRASTFFIGVSILIIFLVIFLFIIFFFKEIFRVGYFVCGVLQAISTLFMFLGNVIYPAGWDSIHIKRLCGDETGKYKLGKCSFRWAYQLSIVAMCCIFMITLLAFALSFRSAKKMREFETQTIAASTRPNSEIPSTMSRNYLASIHKSNPNLTLQ